MYLFHILQALKEYSEGTNILRKKALAAHRRRDQSQEYKIFEAGTKTMSRNHEKPPIRCTPLFMS